MVYNAFLVLYGSLPHSSLLSHHPSPTGLSIPSICQVQTSQTLLTSILAFVCSAGTLFTQIKKQQQQNKTKQDRLPVAHFHVVILTMPPPREAPPLPLRAAPPVSNFLLWIALLPALGLAPGLAGRGTQPVQWWSVLAKLTKKHISQWTVYSFSFFKRYDKQRISNMDRKHVNVLQNYLFIKAITSLQHRTHSPYYKS